MTAESTDLRRGATARRAFSNRCGARRTGAALVTAIAALALAACSSSTGSSAAGPAQTAQVSAAQTALAPYLVTPTSFPVTAPLSHPLPPGEKFVYLQCSTPICAQVGQLLAPAIKEIGATMTVVDAGATAQTAQAAASSAVALKPDAVILGAIDPALFGSGLKTLSAAGTKVISLQIDKNVQPYGITFNYLGTNLSQQNGRLLADWVVANKGAKADTVLYTLPALDISAPVQQSFLATMKTLCPACNVRVVPLDASTIGTTAPSTIVTDLEAHPSTNVAVFVSLSAATGLPAALKAAGLSVTTVGFGPTAGNLQDIKDGALTAALDIDFPVSTWTAVDATARLIEGGQPTAGEQNGVVPEQFLEQKDITFNPSAGWSAFPDFALRFGELWLVH